MDMDEFRILTGSQKKGLIEDKRVDFINEKGDPIPIDLAVEKLKREKMMY